MNKRVCDIIIDSGSSENIVSKAMVTKLGLQTSKHPAPYKICWIKHGTKVKVTEVCLLRIMLLCFVQVKGCTIKNNNAEY